MRKAAVIGDPVAHSLSPRLFSHWFARYGIEGRYDAIQVQPENLKTFIAGLAASGLSGVNVTVPHKEAVLSLLDHVDDTARIIGAVNVITVKNGKLYGSNSDAFGFMENLRQHGFPAKTTKAVVLGAGGAARAVIKALADAGFSRIVIINRTKAKAEALISHMHVAADSVEWSGLSEALADCDLLINTTTLGMKNQPPLNLDVSALPKTTVVCDIIYSPLETTLLKMAKAHGNKTVDGLGMLLYQAVSAFEAWFGVKPEVDETTRKAVLA